MNLQRRIKKHLIARTHTCFAVTGPGLEDLCQRELSAPPLALPDPRIMPGGVAFQGRLHDLYGANLHLRTATRILLRLDRLHALTFQELETRAARIPWELYLPWGNAPRIQVTLHKCRLYHSGAVGQRIAAAIRTRWRKLDSSGPERQPEPGPQVIFVRGLADRFILSLDSSGDPLYLRGLKTQGGRAPLRETLAAAILMRAGYRPGMVLLDPMAGTGTFSLEAALLAAGLPPGWQRRFPFREWPAFQSGRWRHLRRQAAEARVPPPARPAIVALDADEPTCKALDACLQQNSLTSWVTVARGDCLQVTPREVAQFTGLPAPGLVVLNPPYGLRLGDPAASLALYQALGKHLQQHFRAWRLALVIPPQVDLRTFPIAGSVYPLSHGGLALKLLVARI